MKSKDKIERLNALGIEWDKAKQTGSEDRRLTLESDIFLLADELFRDAKAWAPDTDLFEKGGGQRRPDRRAALGDFFIHDWPKFNADKGKLYPYMSDKLEKRCIDRAHGDYNDHRLLMDVPAENCGDTTKTEKKKVWVGYERLDRPISEDGDTALGDSLQSNAFLPEEAAENEDLIVTFLVLHIQLQQLLAGRANNPQKLLYYRMFFTDSFTDLCHSEELSDDCIRHERDVFDAMCVGFLDFFMAEVCRTVPAICGCALKLHGEMVEGCPMAEPGQPLPNNVYKTYLNTHEGFSIKSDGTISNQRDAYKKFLKENLC